MVYMFCNRNEMTDIFSYGTTSDLHVVPQNKPRPFVFDFNKVGVTISIPENRPLFSTNTFLS